MYLLQNSVRMFHPLWMGDLGHFSETATTHPPGCDWLIKNAYKKPLQDYKSIRRNRISDS